MPINTCHFSSKLIPLRTNFISLEQFYVEEKVSVFLCSRERHIKFLIRDTKQVTINSMQWKRHKEQKLTLLRKQCVGAKTKKHFVVVSYLFVLGGINENEEIALLNHFYVN